MWKDGSIVEYNHDGMTVASLYDERPGSFQYVVVDDTLKRAALIDLGLDSAPSAGATAPHNVDLIVDYVCAKGLKVE
jgi:glyoxylase-like metal-dependent hydrolase (beta-lactamase superfamily II)